ncbi:ABC transporter permease [Escherichia coli]|uniref:ABC transporter permease n=1 Tax=Escherichia coli TaxID=562 RepID=UPI0006597BBF|nr:ABC transporter permease [Escherichia coli]KLX63942.1 hypothetical protein SK79_01225 [Escherichia coli]
MSRVASCVLLVVRFFAVAFLEVFVLFPYLALRGFCFQVVFLLAFFVCLFVACFGWLRVVYLWVVVGFSAVLLVVLGIFGYLLDVAMFALFFPLFLVVGVIPFFLFRRVGDGFFGAVFLHLVLFVYRFVLRVAGVVFLAVLLILIFFAVFIVVLVIVWVAGAFFAIAIFLALVSCWVLLLIVFCGVFFLFMVVGFRFVVLRLVLPLLLERLFFLFCLVFSLAFIS